MAQLNINYLMVEKKLKNPSPHPPLFPTNPKILKKNPKDFTIFL